MDRNRRTRCSSALSVPSQSSSASSSGSSSSFLESVPWSSLAPAPHGLPGPLTSSPLTVSVVIPVFNEVGSIAILVERVGPVLSQCVWPFEIVVVDDGSTDGTSSVLRCLATEKTEVRAVVLTRNFGQSAALMAGFDFAAGDVIVTMDGDLQNDPSDIPRLIDCLVHGFRGGGGGGGLGVAEASRNLVAPGTGVEVYGGSWAQAPQALQRGFDFVCGWRKERKDDPLWRNFPSAVANLLIRRLTGVKLHDYGCSLRAYKAEVVRSVRLYGELHRFLPALAVMEGASVAEIPVQHHPRSTGRSKYGIGRVPRVLLDLVLVLFLRSFRDRPIQVFGAVAMLPLLAASAFFVLFSSTALKTGRAYGWAMAMSVAVPHLVASLGFLVAALMLVCLGLVADLCMRTYYESQGRGVYRVREFS